MTNSGQMQPPKVFRPPQGGTVIDNAGKRYFLGQHIGKGAFSYVYECQDEWGNQLVAKVLLPNRSYEEVRKQWLHELHNLFHLRHPNITYLHDAFEYQDTFYLIVERCNSTLLDMLRRDDFQREAWLPYVARDILQAIDFIHRSGYVHKDIHHANIFVLWQKNQIGSSKDSSLVFKVGDLGITKLQGNIKAVGTILAPWMLPPESINPAEYGLIGHTVDIYHVGLLLLSLLLGYIPHFTHQNILAGQPRAFASKHPSPYGAPIARALRRHVKYRTPSALDFWRDIVQATK
jgi:serine/threonine-protein kinase